MATKTDIKAIKSVNQCDHTIHFSWTLYATDGLPVHSAEAVRQQDGVGILKSVRHKGAASHKRHL